MVPPGLAVAFTLWVGPQAPVDVAASPPPPDGIIGGDEVVLGRWDAVVAFHVDLRFCSGTVVAPNLVLTAAHCLTEVTEDNVTDIPVFLGTSADSPAEIANVIKAAPHPEFCDTCFYDRYDLGYIQLEQTVSFPDGFPAVITDQRTWDDVMQVGEQVWMVGFGQTEDGMPTPGSDLGVGLKREVIGEIDKHGDSGLSFRAGGEGHGTCNGDSGGPAMVALPDGGFAVAGVLSGGLGPCGEGGVFGVPLPSLNWIREETGVDLLPNSCENADCIDTRLDDAEGCGCGSEPNDSVHWSWALALLVLCTSRRRGTSSN